MAAEAPRRPIALAVAAAIVVVAAFGGLLLFGAVRPPAFPALADAPDPRIAGTVAFWSSGESHCLSVVDAAGGAVRRLRCDESMYPDALEWTPEGDLAFDRYVAGEEERVTIDAGTGAVIGRRLVAADPAALMTAPSARVDRRKRSDGTAALTDGTDGTAILRLFSPSGEARTLLELTGPRDYAFEEVSWSPDGVWLLVTDSEQRLLVVNADTGDTRLLATDAAHPAWSPDRDPEPGRRADRQ